MTAQAAGDLLKTVVNNTGIIEAHTIDTRGGSIKLLGDMQSGTVNAAGTLDASAPTGGNGGFIDTSAAHVKLADALKVTTASSKGQTGTWLIDPTDYTIAATGGDQTGAFFTNALKSTSVQIQSISGGTGTLGDINVNDTISWSANQLKMTAQNNININQPLRGAGTASLALEYGQQAVAASNTAKYNVKAEIDLPSGQNFSTKLGSDGALTNYTVINTLGAATSTSGTDLQGLKNALSGNFVLGANIDATVTSTWNGGLGFTSIGTNSVPFTGQFDGLGHVITGLNSSTTSAAGVAGLFGSNTGSIRNIGIVAPVISANVASGLAAGAAGLVVSNSGSVSNAYVKGGTITAVNLAEVAGLTVTNSGSISDSYNASTVISRGTTNYTGGLVGLATAASTIINSYNSGDITSNKFFAGGLVSDNFGSIANSFNTGTVTANTSGGGLTNNNRGVIADSFNAGIVLSNRYAGGLAATTTVASKISNSYSTGTVTLGASAVGVGAVAAGGLVGYNLGAVSNSYSTGAVTGTTYVGGVIGHNGASGTAAFINNVYSSGTVAYITNGSGFIGGLVGSLRQASTITNGYFNQTLNPSLSGVGAIPETGTVTSVAGLSSTQMQTASNFANFTFTTKAGATGNNWVMVDTDGTLNNSSGALGATGPMLAAEYSTNIYSSHQLQLMAMNLAGNYTLRQDVNVAATGLLTDVWNSNNFIPVGTGTTTPFTGTLDGAGHVVSGLVINRPGTNFAGLFGTTSSTAIVRNIGLEGGSITGKNGTGALIGSNLGTVSGSFSTVSVSGATQVGGLVGVNGVGSTITNSYASGAVTGTGTIGGLVGLNTGSLINNYASGTVTGGSVSGGLAGSNSGTGTSTGNFWDTTTSVKATSATGTGLTTAQMKLLSTYTAPGWDLAGAWIVYDTNTYPLLRAFMTPLQVTFASNASKTYDGTNSWTAPAYAFSNPNVVLDGTLNYGAAGSAVNAGTYAITAGGLYSGQHGYAISSNAATLTIDRKVATVTGATVVSRDYDGTTAATISGATLSGVLAQDNGNVTVNTGTFDTRDAGSGKAVTALTSGSAGGNYTVTVGALTGTITPKALTLSGLAAATRQYDGSTAATLTGGTLNGLVAGETLNVGASTGLYADKNAGAGKAVTVTIGTLVDGTGLASNYTLTTPTGVTGTITPKDLSWSGLTADNKEYNGNTSASISGGSISGMVGGETLISASSAVFADKNAGNGKTVTVSSTLGNGSGGGLAANYTLADATTTADITPKALTVTGATAGNKVYDGSTAAVISGGTLSGLVGSETVTLGALSGAFGDKNAGNGKAVTVTGGALSNGSNGGLASNYTVGSVTGLSANIAQKALTVSGVSVASKSYDGNTKATISGGTLNGLVGGETLALSGQSGAFNDQNAGNGKAVTVSGATLSDGTGLASNYTVSNATGVTGNITQKALTVTGVTASDKVYDGSLAAVLSGGTLSGLVGSETLGLSSLSGVFGDKNVGSGKTVTVTGGALSDGTGLASNYTVGSVTGLLASITPKALTLSGVLASAKTYDGNTKASLTGGTLNGLVGGESLSVSGLSGTFADQNAGTGKAVTVTGTTLLDGTGLASNYSVSNPSGVTGDITPKALTVTGVVAANKVYDATTKATIAGGTLSGLVGGETLGLSGLSGTFVNKNAGTAKAVTISGATLADGTGLASNYTVSNPTGVTANINQATISSVTNVVADSKVYDGGTSVTFGSATATFNGMLSGDSLAIGGTKAAFSDKNAGTGKAVTISFLTLGGTDAANYTLATTTATGTGTITPKAVTITGMTALNKVYDGSTKASVSGGAISGTVGAETLGAAGLVATFADKDVGTGKTVTTTGTTLVNGNNGGLASNYTVTNPTFTANITPKALTVTGMTAGTRVYDGTTVATLSGGALSGLVSGETLVVSGGTGVFADKNAGNGKAVTVSGVGIADGSGLASNYSVTNPTNVTGNITQKALSVSGALAADKTYDGALDATITGGTLSGFVGSETVNLGSLTGAFADKNAGSGKAVSVTGGTLSNGSNGGLASNYSVGPVTGLSASIAQKALTVTGVAAANKVYDGSTKASVNGGTLSGLVGGETLGLSGLSGAFADKNAGTAKTVTVSGATLADGTGLASNYTVSNPTGVTANINQATISSVTNVVADSKVYDGGTSVTFGSATATFNGMLSGDSLAIGGTKAAFSDKNAGTGKAVTISFLTLGGTDAANYTLATTTATGTGTITPKALTIAGMSAINKVYDGSTKATLSGGSISGLVGSETLGVTGLSASFDDKNAGTGKTVTATGATLVNGSGGGLAANYTISNPTGLLANITPKALTVSGMTAGNKVYDGNTSATLLGGSLSGLVAGETLVVSGGTGVFADKNAGNGKAVTVTGVGIADGTGLASNYTVSNPTGVTGSITQKALMVSGALALDKTYDGSAAAGLTGGTLDSSGFVNDETVNLTALAGEFVNRNAGNGKAVSITGGTLSDGTNGGLASNYVVANSGGLTASIAQKALTVTGVTAGNKVYDATTKATISGGALSGLVAGETLNLSGLSAAFADKNAGTDKAVIVSGAQISDGSGLASNYMVSNPTDVKADIARANITGVTGFAADTRVYNTTTTATVSNAGATFAGMFNGDVLTVSASSANFIDKNAGSGKVVTASGLSLGGTDAGNYNLAAATGTGTGTITQAQIASITGITAASKTYDGTDAATLNAGATFNGLLGSDSLSFSATKAAFSDKNAGSGKTVLVEGMVLGGTDAGNYTLASNTANGTGTITPKALTVTGATAGNKAYDGTLAASVTGGALTGLVSDETLSLSGLTGTFATQNVASNIAVTASGATLADGTGLASNYTVSNPTGLQANITPKELTIGGIAAGNKVYDGTLAASLTGGALQGLVGDETLVLSGTVGVFGDKNAGSNKTVTVSGATLADGTGLASNYTVSNPTGLTASITPKALTVAGQLAGNKVYDGTTAAQLSGGALSGLVAGETLGFGGQTAVFSDKNAANGKTVTVTGTALVDTASGLASNYTVSNPTGLTASITARALTVTGQLAGNKVYDGNAQASLSGGALSGLVAGETLGFGGQNAVFSDKNAANGKAVTVTGTTLVDTASGLASNYTVSNPTGLTASITAKALTVTGQLAGNKVYDGNTAAQLSGGTLSGLVAGETLVIGGQNAAFADKNAGTAKAVTVTGTTLVDTANGLASNYTVSNPTGLTASITPKALTVAGQLAANKVYDGTTAAQLSGGVLAGLVAGESLGLAGQTATFADKNAATAKAVTVTGTTLVDTATGVASNYTVSNPTGLTASITPASLLVRATGAVSRVYDTTTNASVTLGDNRIAGDVLTISNSGASFADKNAGANKTVTVNGIALGGADAGNYIVNTTATTTASITQAALGVKVNNAEKDQGRANPDFTASYTGLIGSDTLANEVSGNLAFSTPATTASPSGSYLVSAAGQSSTNYALTYTPGVLTVNPTEALQSALASVIGTVNVAPSQGNMVQAEKVATGEPVDSKSDAIAVVRGESEPGNTASSGNAPAVQLTGAVTQNVLPGLRLNVIDTGLRMPGGGGNTSVESQ
ncbi:YDG domain-containing protein [Janthinobacterium sp.]|uniref:YDG domain-containing protein n=1 Tax=Janthinobacterium sp. TaxID=1871054 RepID=UPI00289B47E4|nr:YDG domain-containing protein [Janthinobacterium sp.]